MSYSKARLMMLLICFASLFYQACRSLGDRPAFQPSSEVKSPATNEDVYGNRTLLGGLMGSTDTDIPSNFPRFQISGDYPESSNYLTEPPPFPNMILLKSSNLDIRRAEALRWLEEIQKYIYDGMNDQDLSDTNRNFRTGISGNLISMKRWYHMPWLHNPSWVTDVGRGREG
ncbi:MAG: hypothetical protein KBD78_10555, partial [Oligoflexales bacterium]|nr:hypothetical protein [Oligoflexales bacterium]